MEKKMNRHIFLVPVMLLIVGGLSAFFSATLSNMCLKAACGFSLILTGLVGLEIIRYVD